MRIEKGLQKLTKRYFEIVNSSMETKLKFYKIIDEKYFRIKKYIDLYGEHPDQITWQNLYELTCELV